MACNRSGDGHSRELIANHDTGNTDWRDEDLPSVRADDQVTDELSAVFGDQATSCGTAPKVFTRAHWR